MTHKTTRILGLGEFRYTEELLAAAMTRTRADLYREVSERKVYGRSTMDKRALAIVLVDGYLQEQDALDEKRTIARAYLGTPAGEILTDSEVDQAMIDRAAENERFLRQQTGDVSADLSDAINAAVDGVCPDVNHRQGDQRARCGIEVVPLLSGHAPYPCGLLLNADGECPDANHRPAARADRVPDTIEAWRMYANKLRASRAVTEEYAATLVEQRDEAERKRHGLRCALAEQIGRWSVGSAKEAQLSRVLESILKEHR